jgi:uncharacterized protein YjbI with pentapeptide repeats
MLMNANLSGANLLEDFDTDSANLSGAILRGANLSNAKVTHEQLKTADSLKGAIMPDGSKHD